MENRDKEKASLKDKCESLSKESKESDEIKNAHATGLGSMGRSDEALPDKLAEDSKIEPGDY